MFNVRAIPVGVSYVRPFRTAGVQVEGLGDGNAEPGSVRAWATQLGAWLTLGQTKPATAEVVGWAVVGLALWRVFINRRGWL